MGTKKVLDYLISFEPQMVRSYKDHLSKLFSRSTKLKYQNIDCQRVGYSKVTGR